MENNLNKYNQSFIEAFMIEENQLMELKYQDIPEWDSVGHMELMTGLEENFEIEMDIDDIIDFSDYQKGKEILKKYNIEIK